VKITNPRKKTGNERKAFSNKSSKPERLSYRICTIK
jgi:hypothetical protein